MLKIKIKGHTKEDTICCLNGIMSCLELPIEENLECKQVQESVYKTEDGQNLQLEMQTCYVLEATIFKDDIKIDDYELKDISKMTNAVIWITNNPDNELKEDLLLENGQEIKENIEDVISIFDVR